MKNTLFKTTIAYVLCLSYMQAQITTPDSTGKKLPFAIAKEKRLPDDELAEKKEGMYATGVPDLSSDPINGFGAGAEGSLFFNGKKSDPFFEYTPYRAEINLAVFLTTKLQREIKLGFDIPYIFNTKWRLGGEVSYEVNPNLLYFGIDENSLKPLSYYPNNNPANGLVTDATYSNYDKNLVGGKKDYNTYLKKEAVVNIKLERSFYEGRLRALLAYEAAWVDFSTPLNPDSSLLHEDYVAKKIVGFGQNVVTFVQTGFIYDTRDLETNPSKGIFSELTNELSLTALGSQYNCNKTFFHFNAYVPVLPKYIKRLTFAGRIGIGYTDGNAPFYEYQDQWTSEGSIEGLGGGTTLRGYKQSRFLARVMEFTNFELRWRFAQCKILKQHLAFSAVPFFDVGGVWNSFSRLNHLENIRYSEGGGLRIAWNVNTILRFDYAFSKEDHQFFFSLGHAF
ncbi:MAG: BamA/TamA family outer membrane protein [Bacteroidetes bacterium]|nr:BamA/TamA family outer membrane protein [Bacteroidota bacterium]